MTPRAVPDDVEMDRYGIVRCTACGAPVGTKRPLTVQQTRVLNFVRSYIEEHQYAPTIAEVCAHMQYRANSTAHEHLLNLERKGWLRRAYNRVREIELVPDEVRGE